MQSISKSYTTIAFLESGIGLDEKLVKVYPTFSMESRDGDPRKITFRQLLSHWAGLPHEVPLGVNYDERYALLDDHIASLNGSWMKAPAGSRYSYSNVGVDLAGYGLGLEIGQLRGAELLQHGGSGYGYSTMQAWVPSHGIGVVVLADAGDVGFSDVVAHDILDRMLELRGVQRVDKKPPAAVRPSAASLKQLDGSYKTYSNVVSIVAEATASSCSAASASRR